MNVESPYNKWCFGGTIPLTSDDEVNSSVPLVNRNDPVRRIVVGDNLLAPNGSSENIFDVNNNWQVLVESVTIDIDVIFCRIRVGSESNGVPEIERSSSAI